MVNGNGEADCGNALLDSASGSGSGASSGLQISDGRFVLTRVEANVTCGQVRAMSRGDGGS